MKSSGPAGQARKEPALSSTHCQAEIDRSPRQALNLARLLLGRLPDIAGHIHPGNLGPGLSYTPSLPTGLLFLSPEQAGLLPHREVGQPAALYSLGVLLFHFLTGQTPFGAPTTHRSDFWLQLNQGPTPLRELRPDAPRLWEELLGRLLQTDPQDRPQSAQAVLRDLDSMELQPDQAILGANEAPPRLRSPGFVLHHTQLQQLSQTHSGVVVVQGASGCGKSRLLQEWARGRSGPLLQATARSQSSQRPLQLLDDLSRQIVAGELLPENARNDLDPMLSALLPALAPWLGPGQPPTLQDQAQQQTLTALHRLLLALGPCSIVLDDVQWADALTWRLLERWQQEPGAAVIACGMRDEQPLPAGFPHLTLPPLRSDELERLAASMAGPIPPSLPPLLLRCAGGNLFLSIETLRGMEESGLLRSQPSGWSLDQVQASKRATELLTHRLDSLPAATGELLNRGALLGRHFSLSLLQALAQPQAEELLQPAVQAQVLWPVRDGYLFAHDRLREHCLQRLDAEARQQLHAQAARLEQDNAAPDAHALAHHFAAAGQLERAAPHALQAARLATARFDLELAERNYRLAESGARGLPAAERSRLPHELGEVLLVRGLYAEAASRLESALTGADRQQRAAVCFLLGELEISRGDRMQEAAEWNRQGLASLGLRAPQGALAGTAAVLAELAQHLVQLARPPRASAPQLDAQHRRLADGLTQAALIGYFLGDGALFLWSHLKALNQAERFADSPELAMAYAFHGMILAGFGRDRPARSYADRAVAMQLRVGDRRGVARARQRRAFSLLQLADLPGALAEYEQVRQLLARVADPYDDAVAAQNQVHILLLLGRFREARALGHQVLKDSRRIGNATVEFSVLRLLTRLSGGCLAQGVELPEPSPAGLSNQVSRAHLREAHGWLCLFRGSPTEAARHFAAVCASSVHAVEKVGSTLGRITACRQAGELRQAEQAARSAGYTALTLPYVRPYLLREQALLAAARGQVTRARRKFDASLANAQKLGMLYEQARTLQSRARCGTLFAWPNSEEDAWQAARLFRQVGADWELDSRSPSASQADRYARLLDLGSSLLLGQNAEQVTQATLNIARDLFRVDQVSLVPAAATPTLAHTPPVSAPASQTAARPSSSAAPSSSRVAPTRATEVSSSSQASIHPEAESSPTNALTSLPASSSSATDSEEPEEGSWLRCPVTVNGRIFGSLQLSHPELRDLFGAEERQLARLLASWAGVAFGRLSSDAELSASRAHFRRLFHGVGIGLVVLDASGRILESNGRLDPGHDLPDTLEALLHPDSRAPFQQALQQTLAQGGSPDLEIRWLQTPRYAQLTWSRMTPHQAMAAITDISQRKLAEVVRFTENERRLLSSDLHDVISQPLAALTLMLQSLPESALARRAADTATNLVGQLSGLMFSLRVPPLSAQALRTCLLQFRQDSGCSASLDLDGDPEQLSELTGVFLYRILLESLSNVRRHALARQVHVELCVHPSGVLGSVRDDGVGFNLDLLPESQRWGVRGMQLRASLLGGWLTIQSTPGQGCCVQFELPSREAL